MQKIKNIYHLIKAYLACVWYGFPAKKLKVIGITGTDGKTTTTSLIYHILKDCGKKVSMISTIYANIGGKIYETGLHTTTPDPIDIQKYLSLAVKNKDEYFVLETTSHALDQNRVFGVNYEISAITNITHEHLDYHKTYDNLVKTKAKIISKSKKALINLDDNSFKIISSLYKNLKTYSLNNKNADYVYSNKIKTQLLGDFNKYNSLLGFAVCKELGLNDREIISAIFNFKNPSGRMELVYDKYFKVIIDFAHTPNAIDKALSTIKKEVLEKKDYGRLIHVFGSAGLRDNLKRPLMGKASGSNSDIVILTEEDYRTESLDLIFEQISAGLFKSGFKFVMPHMLKTSKEKKVYSVIKDRQKAIMLAIDIAKKNDVVVLTGKSHEKSLCRGDKECPWDEFEAVKKALKYKTN